MIQSIVEWLNGPSGPAWIQALGSVGAIWAALKVSNRQLAKMAEASKNDAEERAHAIAAVAIGAGRYGEMWCEIVRKRPSREDFRWLWSRSFAEIIDASVYSMRQVPTHELRSIKMINAFNGVLSSLILISSKTKSAIHSDAFADQEIAFCCTELSQDGSLLVSYLEQLKRLVPESVYAEPAQSPQKQSISSAK